MQWLGLLAVIGPGTMHTTCYLRPQAGSTVRRITDFRLLSAFAIADLAAVWVIHTTEQSPPFSWICYTEPPHQPLQNILVPFDCPSQPLKWGKVKIERRKRGKKKKGKKRSKYKNSNQEPVKTPSSLIIQHGGCLIYLSCHVFLPLVFFPAITCKM